MPELPEVEQVRISLEPYVLEQKIEDVRILLPRMIVHPSPEGFRKGLRDAVVTAVLRRGKYLSLMLKGGERLMVHLRMTGAFLAVKKGVSLPPFARWGLILSGAYDLWMTDIRTFGTAALYQEGEPLDKGFEALGPEPLDDAMTGTYLKERARHKKTQVKPFILDQSIIAGLGNIYADESLFAAGIRPTKRVSRMTKKEWERLAIAIKEVIQSALRHHGTTFRNYQDANGKMGDNFRYLKVYHRGGKPCPLCGKTLTKTKVAGRGTVYCAHCQK